MIRSEKAAQNAADLLDDATEIAAKTDVSADDLLKLSSLVQVAAVSVALASELRKQEKVTLAARLPRDQDRPYGFGA